MKSDLVLGITIQQCWKDRGRFCVLTNESNSGKVCYGDEKCQDKQEEKAEAEAQEAARLAEEAKKNAEEI